MKNITNICVGDTYKALSEFLHKIFLLFSGRLLEHRSSNCKADSKCLTSLVRILRKYDFRREPPERDRKSIIICKYMTLYVSMYDFNAINFCMFYISTICLLCNTKAHKHVWFQTIEASLTSPSVIISFMSSGFIRNVFVYACSQRFPIYLSKTFHYYEHGFMNTL